MELADLVQWSPAHVFDQWQLVRGVAFWAAGGAARRPECRLRHAGTSPPEENRALVPEIELGPMHRKEPTVSGCLQDWHTLCHAPRSQAVHRVFGFLKGGFEARGFMPDERPGSVPTAMSPRPRHSG